MYTSRLAHKNAFGFEKEITTFHAKAAHEMIKESSVKIDFIGFHGQTIFHNPDEKISKQLGDGKLLSKLTKKAVVYDFRQNDLNNGGQGAPLSPVFHMLLKNKYKLKLTVNTNTNLPPLLILQMSSKLVPVARDPLFCKLKMQEGQKWKEVEVNIFGWGLTKMKML